MLGVLRHGQRWITGFFVVAVGAGMVFYLGVGGGSAQRSPGSVVVVGEQSYGLPEFGRERARRESMLQEQFGDQFDARALSDTLDQLAVQSLIEGAILSREASALGMVVAKSEIERSISAWPYFSGADGLFDPEQFKSWVEWEFGNQRSFIDEQRAAMLVHKFVRTLTQLTEVSEGEARQAALQRMEQLEVDFVKIGERGPAADFEPDPEALEAFLASQEDEIREVYEQRSGLYNLPEQVRARHILLSLGAGAGSEEAQEVRRRAEQILERARAGEDFAQLARELSEDPGSAATGGDLGFFARGQMVSEFEDAAFSREPGTVGELVRSEFGYHILRVEERREAQQRSFEDVRAEIAAEMMGREVARTASRAIADRIAQAVRGGAALGDAAAAEDLALQRSGRLQRRADGYIPELGSSPAVMAAAFQMEPGEPSDRVFEVDGSMVLIQVAERFAPDEAALEAAIEQERVALASQKQQAYLSSWINQARAALAQDGQLIVNLGAVRGNR